MTSIVGQQEYRAGPWGEPPGPIVEASFKPLWQGSSYRGLALLDTGANLCGIPRTEIESAGWVPQGDCELLTPTGVKVVPMYWVAVETLSHRWALIKVVPSEQRYAIIGRDILNDLSLLLNGPCRLFRLLA